VDGVSNARCENLCMQAVVLVDGHQNYGLHTQVLAASIRHPVHVVQASLIGAHVATIPHNVILQLTKHPLTDIGLERFLADAKKIPTG